MCQPRLLRIFGASLASFVFLVIGSSLWGADPGGGEELFLKRCGGCHSLDRDKEGPRLAGVFGRAAGAVGGFPYSTALKLSGVKWTAETLNEWLTDPEKFVPGNDMPFHVEKAAERTAIIAYLKQN